MNCKRHSPDESTELANSSTRENITELNCVSLSNEIQSFRGEFKALYTRFNPASNLGARSIFNSHILDTSQPVNELVERVEALSQSVKSTENVKQTSFSNSDSMDKRKEEYKDICEFLEIYRTTLHKMKEELEQQEARRMQKRHSLHRSTWLGKEVETLSTGNHSVGITQRSCESKKLQRSSNGAGTSSKIARDTVQFSSRPPTMNGEHNELNKPNGKGKQKSQNTPKKVFRKYEHLLLAPILHQQLEHSSRSLHHADQLVKTNPDDYDPPIKRGGYRMAILAHTRSVRSSGCERRKAGLKQEFKDEMIYQDGNGELLFGRCTSCQYADDGYGKCGSVPVSVQTPSNTKQEGDSSKG